MIVAFDCCGGWACDLCDSILTPNAILALGSVRQAWLFQQSTTINNDCCVWLLETIMVAVRLRDNLWPNRNIQFKYPCHALQTTGMFCKVYAIVQQALLSILLLLLLRYTWGRFISRSHTIPPSLLEKGGCKNYWMVIHSELKPSSACDAMSSGPLFEPLWILDSDHQNTSRMRNRLPFSCMEVWQDCPSAILVSDFNTQMEPYPVISKLF